MATAASINQTNLGDQDGSSAATINPLAVMRIKSLALRAKAVVEGFYNGLHRSPFHGFSVEFSEYRPYTVGDDLRGLDWKLYARTEKLFIKSYEEETNLRCQLVIDNSKSMYYPDRKDELNKIAFSIYASAAIMELMKRQRDAVGMSTFPMALNISTRLKKL